MTLLGVSFGVAETLTYDQMVQGLYLGSTAPLLKAEEVINLQSKGPVYLLDTRSRPEYEVSHLLGATFVDYDTFKVGDIRLPKEATIVVYCSVGWRSGKVVEQLRAAGYSQSYNLYGGMFLWFNQGRPVYRGNTVVDEIHPYNDTWGVWITRGKRITVPPPPVSLP